MDVAFERHCRHNLEQRSVIRHIDKDTSTNEAMLINVESGGTHREVFKGPQGHHATAEADEIVNRVSQNYKCHGNKKSKSEGLERAFSHNNI